MELIFGIAFAVAVAAFTGVGLAVASSAEGPDTAPGLRSPLNLRLARAALLAVAIFMTILGAEAAAVAAWFDDPSTGRAEGLVFLLEGLVELGLIVMVLLPAWNLRRVWVIRLISVCWLVVGPPALVLTSGRGPIAGFYLGAGADVWATFSVVAGVMLVWLASLGGPWPETPAEGPEPAQGSAAVEAHADAGATAAPPVHTRAIFGGVILACLVAVSSWPMAQFAGVLTMGGCVPQWLVPSNPRFCVSGAVEYGLVVISGDTSLPDGALVDVTLTSDYYPLQNPETTLRVPAKGGAFQASFTTVHSRPGPITVTVALSAAGQPANVASLLGDKGSAISGPTAVDNGTAMGITLLVTLHLEIT